MSDTVLTLMAPWQWIAVGICFVWSGFVRSGLGFGGAALTLPMLLMINNDPLFYLPAICWHLLFFSLLTVATRWSNVDWSHVRHLCLLLIVPFAVGLFGLLNLSGNILSLFVYGTTLFYGCIYMLDKLLVSRHRYMDAVCILGGGYASGVSLVGAPLIVAYSTGHLRASQLRDTLFVLWLILVVAKISTFVVAGVDLQWSLTLFTFPLVALGHWLGLQMHNNLLLGHRKYFHRVIGVGLVGVSILGLWSGL
jgi:uncharacterized membrane protein YfcA